MCALSPPLSFQTHIDYGAPATFWLTMVVPHSGSADVSLTLQWFDKTMTRLPEALFFSFVPIVSDANKWKISKLGSWISPIAVDIKGNRHVHATDDGGVAYNGADGRMALQSLDAALVSVGAPTPFPTPFGTINPQRGMHFNLFNNIWVFVLLGCRGVNWFCKGLEQRGIMFTVQWVQLLHF